MCPIHAFFRFLILIFLLLLITHTLVAKAWKISTNPKDPTINMYEAVSVDFNITGPDKPSPTEKYHMLITSQDPDIASVEKEIELNPYGLTTGNFTITGNFLGRTLVSLKIKNQNLLTQKEEKLPTTVIRKKRVIDTVFSASVATLVSIMYINFGCALKWGELKSNLKRPIGPVIGFIGQFVFMPVISYVLGKVLFPDNPEMQLGMFFTGVSPGGGASNMWTVILNGNLNLSITMTTISTFAAFFMMPLWLFTLGKVLFNEGNLTVPYKEISTYAVALIVPLFIGYLIQRFLKKVGQFLARILKGFASLLLIFIIIFAIVTNLYLFNLFSWQIIVAGMGLPWLGYLLAWGVAKVFRQEPKDCLTIAIETGIQNSGIAIFLLRFTLPQPAADLTTICPVAVSIMTPLPLLCIFLYQKLRERCCVPNEKLQKLDIDTAQTECVDIDDNCNREKLVSSIS